MASIVPPYPPCPATRSNPEQHRRHPIPAGNFRILGVATTPAIPEVRVRHGRVARGRCLRRLLAHLLLSGHRRVYLPERDGLSAHVPRHRGRHAIRRLHQGRGRIHQSSRDLHLLHTLLTELFREPLAEACAPRQRATTEKPRHGLQKKIQLRVRSPSRAQDEENPGMLRGLYNRVWIGARARRIHN